MPDTGMRLKVLGARGSMATSGSDYLEYGGATSCYLVRAGDESVLLDAGTGLLDAPTLFPKPPVILLSHLHMDHLLGLTMYERHMMRDAQTTLYLPARDDEEARARLSGIIGPPYWPVKLTEYPGDLCVRAMPTSMRMGSIHIDTMQGCHPGGCLVFRLSVDGKSLVYVGDFEHESDAFSRLVEFCEGTDLLLYDGQYSEEEYPSQRGFGHSTPQRGIELMRRCGARRMLIIHHAPRSTDAVLQEREKALGCPAASFARAGREYVV